MRLNLVTGKGLLSADGVFGATGGFVPEMVVLRNMVDELVLHAPVARCRSLDGADAFPQSITVQPLAQASRKWQQVFTVPWNALLLAGRLKRGDAAVCYVPSSHPIGAVGVVVCQLKGILRVVCVRGSLLRTIRKGTLPRHKSLLLIGEQKALNWAVRRCQRGRWTYSTAREDDLQEWSYGGASPTVFDPVLPVLPEPLEKVDRTVLFVGRIEKAKGAHDLVSAVGLLPAAMRSSFQVWMVGKECDGGECRRLVAEHGLGTQVSFLGSLPFGQSLFDLYGRARYFVLPSYSESFGKVAVEAMAAGCAVIVSEGVPCVSNGLTGLRVPLGNPSELAIVISSLEKDHDRRAQLIRNGIEFASRYRRQNPFERIVRLAVELARSRA